MSVLCVVGYVRFSAAELRSDPELLQDSRSVVRRHADLQGLPVAGFFFDSYGTRRTMLDGFPAAVALAQEKGGLLVLPTLGATGRDSRFLEALYNTELPFAVVDRPGLTRDALLPLALSKYRGDLRRILERD